MKKNSGVSMITLVITIIVIIILTAVAFSASTKTIDNANFSDFANDIAEVQGILKERVVTLKGEEAAKGVTRTDAQVYNYVAKGATLENDESGEYWLSRADAALMDCTQLNPTDMKEVLEYELPTLKVVTPNSRGVECSYFVTSEGVVFVWPPMLRDGELWVNGQVSVAKDATEATALPTTIKVGNVEIVINDAADTLSGDTANADDGDATIFYNATGKPNKSPEGRELNNLYTFTEAE